MNNKITLSHGGGGKAMRDLIEKRILSYLGKSSLPLEDQARIPLVKFTSRGDRLAFTTDSYVVDPIIFPGGNIGSLAINGTVNDLVVGGATPLYLSCSFILEEGFDLDEFDIVLSSMRDAAENAGIKVVTGDTKVVDRGKADKIFINTAGVGVIQKEVDMSVMRIAAGDKVIVNGDLGDHGVTILAARDDLALQAHIESDCAPLNRLVDSILAAGGNGVHAMRDITRGGLATVLNEFADGSGHAIRMSEIDIPIKDTVRGVCEILGLDPLYLANEGKLAVVVAEHVADEVLSAMRATARGENACIVAEVCAASVPRVTILTSFGAERIVDMLVGDQLPRIC